MFGKFQFRKVQFGESIEGKLFFETVRPYYDNQYFAVADMSATAKY